MAWTVRPALARIYMISARVVDVARFKYSVVRQADAKH